MFDTFIHAMKRLLLAHKMSVGPSSESICSDSTNSADKFGGLVSQVTAGTLAGACLMLSDERGGRETVTGRCGN